MCSTLTCDFLFQDGGIRAGWAARALIGYVQHLDDGSLTGELESVVSDLLADLRHLCDALNLDWDEMDVRARRNYVAEIIGDL